VVLIILKKKNKMEKKFANLGKMLSRAQAKKIIGGKDSIEEPCPSGSTKCFCGTTSQGCQTPHVCCVLCGVVC
jgi:hypothetical protein